MTKRYLAIGSWTDKATGKPVTRLAEISSGVNKSGNPYELIDTERRETVDGTYPIGTILTASLNLSVQNQPDGQRNLKIAPSK